MSTVVFSTRREKAPSGLSFILGKTRKMFENPHISKHKKKMSKIFWSQFIKGREVEIFYFCMSPRAKSVCIALITNFASVTSLSTNLLCKIQSVILGLLIYTMSKHKEKILC